MKTHDRPHPNGHPSWLDLVSPDVERAADFYARLFGWSYSDTGADFGHYHMAHSGERNAAGLGQRAEGSDLPSAWTVYYATDDVDATTEKARSLGATVVVEPMEVPGSGKMSIVQDPTGAVFGLWEARGHIGAGITDSHGAMSWYEVATRDAEAARDFYSELFGASAEPMEGTGTTYYMLAKDDIPIGGVMQMNDRWEGIPPHWLAYFGVDDVDRAIVDVEEGGGSVAVAPFDTAFGRIAVVSDPFGATFSLVERPEAA